MKGQAVYIMPACVWTITDLCSGFNTLDKTSVSPNKTGLHRVYHLSGEHFNVMRIGKVSVVLLTDMVPIHRIC